MVYSDALLQDFGFYAAIVILKVLLMAPATGFFRMANKAFANEEDAKIHGGGKPKADEQVERVRRAHLNDLENAIPFVLIGLIYVLTANPGASWALWHFRIFTLSRIAHSFVYVGCVPQPARAIAFAGGFSVCLSMILQIIF